MKKLLIFLALSVLAIASDYTLPTNLGPPAGTWAASGIPAGIPSYPNLINVTLPPYNATGDGVTDDTAAIQSAITACTNGNAVYLPKPSAFYRTTAQLDVFNQSIVIRGDGRDVAGNMQTWIKLDTTNGGDVIKIYRFSTPNTYINITSGYTKGSTSMVLADASSLTVGQFILVTESNETGLVTNTGYDGAASWVGAPGKNGASCMTQYVQITSKASNTIGFTPSLYYDFQATYTPQVKQVDMVTLAGVENLGVQRLHPSVGQAGSSNGIEILFAYNAWISGCESYMTDGAHFLIRDSHQCQIQDSYWHEGFSNGSGKDYGCYFYEPNSGHRVVNCIAYKCRHSIVAEGGLSGSVWGYNYTKDNFDSDDPTFLNEDLDFHGANPYMNLIEGNICAKLDPDFTWGSNNYNTWYRNYVSRISNSATSGLRCVEANKFAYFQNYVGNVFGPPSMTGVYTITNTAVSNTGVYQEGYLSPGATGTPIDANVAATSTKIGNWNGVNNAIPVSETLSGQTLALTWFGYDFAGWGNLPHYSVDSINSGTVSTNLAKYWFEHNFQNPPAGTQSIRSARLQKKAITITP